ncbi:MAG: NAD(P)-dependent oxidoreductase [Burkholderiaceae bacterium]
MYSNYSPSAAHLHRLRALAGDDAVAEIGDEASALALAPQLEIVLGHRYLRQIMPRAERLRWVQSSAAGVDHLPCPELAERGVLLSRNPVNSDAIAHHVIAMAWALQRRLPAAVDAQRAGRWAAPFVMLPAPRRALVLGLGEIGLRVAALLRGLGVHVRGSSRSGSPTQRAACDEFVDAGRWHAVLPDTDLLVLALPLTRDTRLCIGAAELARLPADAVLINVARAGLVDLAEVIGALQRGQLGGAGLDVLDPVPAADDALWRMPELLITPKVSAYHPRMQADFESFVESQLLRFRSGQPLQSTVDAAAYGE